MDSELKPCPFCGSANIESRFCDYGQKVIGKPYIVGCRDCGISTSMYYGKAKNLGYKTAKEAAEAQWNRRTEVTELTNLLGELVATAAELEESRRRERAAVAMLIHSCETCDNARADGGCNLLPDGDAFSPDYTEGFDRDDCDNWYMRVPQGAGEEDE